MIGKQGLGLSVLEAAQLRLSRVFDEFDRICVSFSGGKDSSVMLHLAMSEAKARNRKVGVLFVDLEAQYALTIQHVRECFDLYRDSLDPFWVSLPIRLRNAVSVLEPQWTCWDPDRKGLWVRQPDPDWSITDTLRFPFFRPGMEFEEFVPAFGAWYSQGSPLCCLVGIRTDESLNRWRTIASRSKTRHAGLSWTTTIGPGLVNAYPIYDWRTEDLWTYTARTGHPHNQLYDRMHQAGLTLSQMRICQPYGDDQRKGLWLFHLIEPETWSRVVARVSGANSGALYAQDSGNITGRLKIHLPKGQTWQGFATVLLESMPQSTREQFKNKIAWFLHFWSGHGYPDGIPDVMPAKEEAVRSVPSWRRICKVLLRNDWWCKGLSFSPQKSTDLDRYLKRMRERRQQWNLMV